MQQTYKINPSAIRQKTREKFMTLVNLANVSGVSYPTISALVNNKTNRQATNNTVLKLAKALEVEPKIIIETTYA